MNYCNCVSRYCKVSLLVIHHIAFHRLEPLSRQKSASCKDSFINTFAGFSSQHFALLEKNFQAPLGLVGLWDCGTVALAHTAKVPCLPGSQQCLSKRSTVICSIIVWRRIDTCSTFHPVATRHPIHRLTDINTEFLSQTKRRITTPHCILLAHFACGWP